MTKIVTLIAILTSSVAAFASPNYSTLSQQMYPNNIEDQAFVSKFFDIVEAHKTNDPLLEGRGPSINEYSLDKIKFAYMVNETSDTLDLVFFNWNLSLFEGLELQSDYSKLYGSNVYILKGINKKSVASQGKNRSEVTNFSYIFGAHYMEMQIKKDNPTYQVPEQLLDWKPNPDYMARSHPLRATLNTNTLVLLSPSKDLFLKQAGMTEQTKPYFEAMMNKNGGFYNMIMGMMVHEMFHVKEGEDQVNNLAKKRKISEDRKSLVAELQADNYLKSLMATYVKIVFSIGESLKDKKANAQEPILLADLNAIITEMKSKYQNVWNFIWNYEYTEGFAEYVSAYSMVQGGIVSLAQKIDLEKADTGNNFAYRTGALGGLYLATRLNEMPFKNQEDHAESVWQIILRKNQTAMSSTSPQDLIAKYSNVQIDGDNEVKRVIDYLVSTVMDVK